MAYKGSLRVQSLGGGSVGRNGGLDDSRDGRRFQTSEGECKKGFYQWTNVSNRHWQDIGSRVERNK